jgi:hypothetical protein
MKNLFLLSLLIFLPSCVSAQADVDMCKTYEMSFITPTKLVGVSAPTVSYSVISSFSDELKKIKEFGTLEVRISESSLTDDDSDLNWVSYVSIHMVSLKDKEKYPSVLLAEKNVTDNHGKILLDVKQPGEVVEKYLSAGEVQFTYSLAGTAPTNAKLKSLFCLAVTAKVDKSVSDF